MTNDEVFLKRNNMIQKVLDRESLLMITKY